MNKRKYRVVKSGGPWGCDALPVDFEFAVSKVDEDDQWWSEDVTFTGKRVNDGEGWCVCTGDALRDGYLVEVPQ